MTNTLSKKTFAEEVEKELRNNILEYWIKNTIDIKNDGFYARISNDGVIDENSVKGGILNSRILWTFSKAYLEFRDPTYMAMANRAYKYMMDYMWDKEYGGIYFYVDNKGMPVESRKQVYNMAFGIYALVEYYQASGNIQAFQRALDLYRIIEAHMYDAENKGYFEACSRDFSVVEHFFAYEVPDREKKSMNTHLHILEAYTQLYKVWKNEKMAQRLKELIEITLDKIIDQETHHFKVYFDEKWNVKTDEISYGHDIEGSWLLFEAAEMLGDVDLLERVRQESIKMAEVSLEQALDNKYGGVYDRLEQKTELFDIKVWWIQAEGLVGFLNAYELTGDEKYYSAACNIWEFIKKYMVDKENGEWYWQVERNGIPDKKLPKIEPWKCPYHHGRAGFESIKRLLKLSEKE